MLLRNREILYQGDLKEIFYHMKKTPAKTNLFT